MKLRVRLAGAPDAPLLRADDVQPTQSIEQLSARCRAHFADWLSSSPSSSSPPSRPLLTFSLNKKDALLPDGDGTAPVSALGVTSGDLLWIIDACVAREAAAAVAPVAAATATTGGGVGRGARSMQPAPAAAAAPNEQLAADDEAGAEENEEEEHHHHHQAPAEPLLPAHLRRALSALGPAAATPVALLAAAVHAAMLEAGFEAVGADAAEEQQKQQQQQEQQNPPNRRRRRYRHGAGAGDVSYPPVSGAGGEQLSAARAAEGVRVEVRCAPLGGASVLVAGSVTSSSAAAAAAAGGAAASSAPAAPPPTTAVVTLTLSVAEHVRDDEDEGKGEGEPMETEDGGPLPQNNYNRHSRRLVAAPALWRRLKDGLCSPLLAAHHRAAGLPPPAGLLALPLDLLVREVLPRVVASSGGNEEAAADGSHETDGPPAAAAANAAARSLASCCLACSALRAAASDDALWRPVFEAEANAIGGAGDPSVPLLRANAERRGWRWAAAALVAERRRRARLARLRQRRALAQPWPGGMIGGPRAPFFPAPPGFRGAPGIIGGDYDRLPGGGGGRGGGGFGGGGSGFGGSGGGGFFFAAQGGGGAAGSAMPGPAPGPFGMPGAGGSRRGGGGGGGRDFALRH